MSPRVKPKPKLPEWRREVRNPSAAEFRSEAAKGEYPRAFDEDAAASLTGTEVDQGAECCSRGGMSST